MLTPRIMVPIAIFGATTATALTLLHYAQSHRSSSPGGYFALITGAVVIGLLCGAGNYLVGQKEDRSGIVATAVGVLSALATAALLFAVLIWSYGS
jgi:hypothetical protein